MEKEDAYREYHQNGGKINGSIADMIITTLIDNADDELCAAQFEISKAQWCEMVQQFEEQIRHKVRDIR